jgi:hypothetical protein
VFEAAMAEVAELTRHPNWNAFQWYNFACVYALASGKTPNKSAENADRAMELLQKAVSVGYKNTERITKDADLDPLRDRADFKTLLDSLPRAKDSVPRSPGRELAPAPRMARP